MTRRRIHQAILPLLLLALGCNFFTYFNPPACRGTDLARTEALPGDQIPIHGVETELDSLYGMYETSEAEPQFVPVARSDEGPLLITPPHPARGIEGGEGTLRLMSEDRTCGSFDLTILPLEPAPGALEASTDTLVAIIDSELTSAGLNPSTPLEGLSQEEISQAFPLLVAWHLVSNPENPNSLRAISSGESESYQLTARDRDLVDAVISRMDLTPSLGAISAQADDQSSGILARRTPSALALDAETSPIDVDTADELSELMKEQAECESTLSGATGQLLQDSGYITLAIGTYNPAAGAVLGAASFAHTFLHEYCAYRLPAEFVELEFHVSRTTFPEDYEEPAPGISMFRAHAQSDPWDVSGILISLALAGGGRLDDLMDAARLGRAADEFITKLNQVLGEIVISLCGRIDECQEATSLTLSPVQYGPIREFDENHLETGFRPAPESALKIRENQFDLIRLVDTGTSRLFVRTKVGVFGPDQFEATDDLTVNEIEVTASPDSIRVEPNQQVCFQGDADHAEDESLEWYQSGPEMDRVLAGTSDGTGAGDDFCFVAPDWELTQEDRCEPPEPETREYLIEAISASKGGLRADGIPERSDTATVTVIKEPEGNTDVPPSCEDEPAGDPPTDITSPCAQDTPPGQPPKFDPDCAGESLPACQWVAIVEGVNQGIYRGNNAFFLPEEEDPSPGLEIALFQTEEDPTDTQAIFTLGYTPGVPGLPSASIGFGPAGGPEGYGGEGDMTVAVQEDDKVIGAFSGEMWVDPVAMIMQEAPSSLVGGMFHACPSDGQVPGDIGFPME